MGLGPHLLTITRCSRLCQQAHMVISTADKQFDHLRQQRPVAPQSGHQVIPIKDRQLLPFRGRRYLCLRSRLRHRFPDRVCLTEYQPVDHQTQVILTDRFGDVLIHACLKTAFLVPLQGVGRHGDNRYRRQPSGQLKGTDCRGCLESVHDRHLDIHKNQVEVTRADLIQCILAVDRLLHTVPLLLQHDPGQFAVDLHIIYQQDRTAAPGFPHLVTGDQSGAGLFLAVHDRLQGIVQLSVDHRLGQITVHLQLTATTGIPPFAGAGQQQQFQVVISLIRPDPFRQAPAVNIRHLYIRQQQLDRTVRQCCFQFCQRFFSACSRQHLHPPAQQKSLQQLTVDGHIIHHQCRNPLQGAGLLSLMLGLLLHAADNSKPEGTALTKDALNTDLAPHQLHQSAADRQPQTGAAVPLGGRAVCLLKGGKDLLQVFRFNADPPVPNLKTEGHLPFRLPCRH